MSSIGQNNSSSRDTIGSTGSHPALKYQCRHSSLQERRKEGCKGCHFAECNAAQIKIYLPFKDRSKLLEAPIELLKSQIKLLESQKEELESQKKELEQEFQTASAINWSDYKERWGEVPTSVLNWEGLQRLKAVKERTEKEEAHKGSIPSKARQ